MKSPLLLILIVIVIVIAPAHAQALTISLSPERAAFNGYNCDGRVTWHVTTNGTAGRVAFAWLAEIGAVYRVQMKTELVPATTATNGSGWDGQEWFLISPPLSNAGGVLRFTNGALRRGFYQLTKE